MDDKFTYLILNARLNTFAKNIDSIVSNINNFEKICSSALVLNDSTSYKNSVVNLEKTVEKEQYQLYKEILPEVRQNM